MILGFLRRVLSAAWYILASPGRTEFDMLRREFIAGAAATCAFSAPSSRLYAQQPTRRTRVGVLIYSTPERDPNTQALLEGFRQLGYVDGQNIAIEYRSAQGRAERLPELVRDLVQSKPDVI